VKLGPMADDLRVVRDGLQQGDVIVVSGLQRVRPGAAVTPKRVPMAAKANAPNDTSTQSALAGGSEKSRDRKVRE
jgi:hypothetical protein